MKESITFMIPLLIWVVITYLHGVLSYKRGYEEGINERNNTKPTN